MQGGLTKKDHKELDRLKNVRKSRVYRQKMKEEKE